MTEFLKENISKVLVVSGCLAAIILLCFAVTDVIRQKITDNEIEIAFSENDKKDLIEVYVDGEVKNKGKYTLRNGANVGDAVEAAGGYTKEANRKINAAFLLENGSRVTVKDKSQNANSGIAFKVNINTATEKELVILDGIGEKTAENIIKYREKNGKFKSPADIIRVKGIGPGLYEDIRDTIIAE